jgi:hypothetical protein
MTIQTKIKPRYPASLFLRYVVLSLICDEGNNKGLSASQISNICIQRLHEGDQKIYLSESIHHVILVFVKKKVLKLNTKNKARKYIFDVNGHNELEKIVKEIFYK